jgi:hypothetical protein
MIKKLTLILFILFFSNYISAQEGWEQINYPLKSLGHIEVSRDSLLFVSHDNSHTLVDPVYKMAYSNDDGRNWKLLALDKTVTSFYVIESNNLWVGLVSHDFYTVEGLFFSSDLGKHWQERNDGFSSKPWVTNIYKTFNHTLVSMTNFGVFNYIASNSTWEKLSDLSIPPAFESIIKSYKNNEILIAAGPYGYSLDNGQTWKYYEPGYWRGNIIDLTKNLKTNDVFIGTWFYDYGGTKVKHGKVLRLFNYEPDWEQVFELPYDEFVVSLFNDKNGTIILVSTKKIFYTLDDGITWTQYAKVSSLEKDIKTSTLFKNKLYIGTVDNKLYETTLDFITISNEELAEWEYSLEQNYPNPFNVATTIDYNTMNDGLVHISIYNILGEKMCDLINGYQERGFHSIYFNASNLCSGIYFYRLVAGNYSQTKKFVLLK